MIPDSLRQRIENLERQIAVLTSQQQREHVPAIGDGKREVFLARTINSGYPSAPATVYPIVFVDVAFTASAGNHTPTITNRSATPQAFAYAVNDGTYIDPGTLGEAWRQNNRWLFQPVAESTEQTVQIVRVDGSGGISNCGDVDDNASCVWEGQRLGMSFAGSMCGDGMWTDIAPVWLKVVNRCSLPTVLKKGERYIGRKVGSYDVGGDVRDLYQIQTAPDAETSTRIVRVDASGGVGNCELTERESEHIWPGFTVDVTTSQGEMNPGDADNPYSDADAVWLVAINHCDQITKLKKSERYLGLKVGTFDNGGDERPLYAIKEQTRPGLQTVVASADIEHGTSGNVARGGGTPFLAYNPGPKVWSGATCLISPGDDEETNDWHIVKAWSATRMRGTVTGGDVVAGTTGSMSIVQRADGHFGPSTTNFFLPTVFVDVADDMVVWVELVYQDSPTNASRWEAYSADCDGGA